MRHRRTVRVFLSSTFRDFAEERDLLVRKVFPELRRKCRERQVELIDVDLRWGITEEEAQQGKVLPICLAEIDRSRPYFMGFIGERYGWVPEAPQYDPSLVREQPWLEEHQGGKSVTELEMLHGVLNDPAMAGRAFFYFRDPEWSRKCGGPYLSEGPREKAKLEALKQRIRESGFPVMESYPTPDALAEQLREDLWQLINKEYPENEVPDALAQQRMRHEAFAASRLGLYIGGETYFEALDANLARESPRPMLVTGASGGGKTALLANWLERYSTARPDAFVLTHFLATGTDAAHPLSMVVRTLQEIARITGQNLPLESDPRKTLLMFGEWLERAGVFARENGSVFVLVIDAFEKMAEPGLLDWWPKRLPEGVALIASCLEGVVRDALTARMEWNELRVVPLERPDCERFIRDTLAKYRKALTPDQSSRILAHPLRGNPLFLKTLLEELRVFGVHEELNQRLEHYLLSRTMDDLFQRVLDRIESDNTPETVRAALEVLWAAKESFAEDELVVVSGLPHAVWAPIHSALDESLIGTDGRLAFGHDYLRKAVEHRYINSPEDLRRIQRHMAAFCAESMGESRKDASRYVRRHGVMHFLEADDWDNAVGALTDLEFVEARAKAKELNAMLLDYCVVDRFFPQKRENKRLEEARRNEAISYGQAMLEYAAACARIRAGDAESRPVLPQPPRALRLQTHGELAAERRRLLEKPAPADTVKAFRNFLGTHLNPLMKYANQEGFVALHARNSAADGPVHRAGVRLLEGLSVTKVLRRFDPDDFYDPCGTGVGLLSGHSGTVRSIALTPDGGRIVSASDDQTLRLWNVENGECLRVYEGHTHWIHRVVITPDGRRIISGADWGSCGGSVGENGERIPEEDDDKNLRVWDLESGACLQVLAGHTNRITALAVTPDGRQLISGGRDKTLRVWDLESGKCVRVIDGHSDFVSALAVTSDGNHFVSGSWDRSIKVWDATSGQCLRELHGHADSVLALALTPDGRRLASAGGDCTVRLWDLESGRSLGVLRGHTKSVSALALTPDGRRLVSSSWDQTIRVWDTEKEETVRVLRGQTGRFLDIAVTADGVRVYSCGDAPSIEIWDIQHGDELGSNRRHLEKISTLALALDGQRAFSGGDNDTVCLWDTRQARCLNAIERGLMGISSIAVSPCGKAFFARGNDQQLRKWEGSTGECTLIFEELIPRSGSFENRLQFQREHTREERVEIQTIRESLRLLELTPDGKRLVSVTNIHTPCVWDTQSGRRIRFFEGHTDRVTALAVSLDGELLISADAGTSSESWVEEAPDGSFVEMGKDESIRVWEIETGKSLGTLGAWGLGGIDALLLTPDGLHLVSLSNQSMIRIWALKEKTCLRSLETENLVHMALSPDGRLLFTSHHRNDSGEDRPCIKIWDVESFECLTVIDGLETVGLLKPTPCGRRLLLGSDPQTLRVWDIENGKFICSICFDAEPTVCLDKNHLVVAHGSRLFFATHENLLGGPLITTAYRELPSQNLTPGSVTARPACCGKEVPIPKTTAERISHWTLHGGGARFTDGDLLLDCPGCQTPLRMNPFFLEIRPKGC